MPHRDDFHSEEAQEVLGRIPSWITRWGVTVIFAVFALIVAGACIIKYPERVSATITITTDNAPIDVVSRAGGELERIFAVSGALVREGELLAVVSSSADYGDVLDVSRILDNPYEGGVKEMAFDARIYSDYGMGGLQGDYSAFSQACSRYKDYLERSVIFNKIRLIEIQIDKQKEYYSQLEDQWSVMTEDFEYERKSFERDSLLYAQRAISETEYDQAARSLLQGRNEIMSFAAQMTSTELSIIQLEQQAAELSMQYDDETAAYEQEILSAKEVLAAQIEDWKMSYLMVAPVDGTVSFVRKWDQSQFINAGDVFLTVVPQKRGNTVGIIRIPQESFGKVALGQRVNVRLSGYPYMEYGMLAGRIEYISSVPEAAQSQGASSNYVAQVGFPDGMRTTYGKEISLIQKMEGSAEIITQDRRLIMRFLDPIVALFDRGL